MFRLEYLTLKMSLNCTGLAQGKWPSPYSNTLKSRTVLILNVQYDSLSLKSFQASKRDGLKTEYNESNNFRLELIEPSAREVVSQLFFF